MKALENDNASIDQAFEDVVRVSITNHIYTNYNNNNNNNVGCVYGAIYVGGGARARQRRHASSEREAGRRV
jgi:hypothetical protein